LYLRVIISCHEKLITTENTHTQPNKLNISTSNIFQEDIYSLR